MIKIEVYSSAQRKHCGGTEGGCIWINGVNIMSYGRGLNIAIINGYDGTLRAGCATTIPSLKYLDGTFINFLEHNVNPNDFVVMTIVGAFPFHRMIGVRKLQSLGASGKVIDELSRVPEGQEDSSIFWCPWIFVSQNNRALLNKVGAYCETVSGSVENIELTSEREARIKKEQEEEQRKVAEAQKEREAAAHTARLMASQKAEQDKIIAALKAEMDEKVNASEREKEELRKTFEEAKKEGQRRDREATKAAASAREKEAEYVRKQRESVLSQLRAQKEELLRRQGLLSEARGEMKELVSLSQRLDDAKKC